MAKKKQKKHEQKSKKKKAQNKVKSCIKESTRLDELRETYYIAKVKDNFEYIRAVEFESHSDWLWYMHGISDEDSQNLILGYIRNKSIVLFTGSDKHKVDKKYITVEDIMQLRDICRDKLGLGNYKVYNGIRYDTEKCRYEALGTIIDFDIRKTGE